MNDIFTTNQEIDLLKEAIRIFAPSFKEEELTNFIINKILNPCKINHIIDDLGNLSFSIGNGHPIILLSSHLDTIDDPLDFSEDKDFIYGRGAVDCRAALMSMILAICRIKKKIQNGMVIFAGIVGEEISTKGIDYFLQNNSIKPDMAIFGEPTSLKICIAYKGRAWINIKIMASEGHVASAWNYINPINVFNEFYEKLSEFLKSLIKNKKLSPFYTPIASITTIHSGNIPNVLPKELTADIDIRFPPNIDKIIIKDYILKLTSELKEINAPKDKRFDINIEIKSLVNGVRTKTDNELNKTIARSIKNIIKNEPVLVKKTGTTFMNQIWEFYKCPTITFGPGDPSLEHTINEKISIKEYLNSIKILEDFLLNTLK
ncbi:MAG: M20/M25/M40 family metallo-hydrolase [Promethearchaeota archaeon]